jgi:valyl-tRNA synthetase
MWDIDFETAVAQAEIEDREEESFYHYINFPIDNDEVITIATTRPELLPACIGITAHPNDKRYKHLFGRIAITPLFHVPVPIFPSEEADPDKGTGILMVCSFGDAMDVEWWKREKLPLRQVIGKNGRILPIQFGKDISEEVKIAQVNMDNLQGKTVKTARKEILQMLEKGHEGSCYIARAPEKISHPVRFYEKGKRALEILSSRQWFLRIMDKKKELLEIGDQINWHPAYMHKRYADWTENLKFDWCISRQRFFGVPIPVWYPLDDKDNADLSSPILPEAAELPVDPASDIPEGFSEKDRDHPGGFTAEKDIFDTWFTSSMTPQIGTDWIEDKELHKKIFPMSIRPQSHEIIRTWTFYTIVKSLLHEQSKPWENVLISGWILDNERKKMSKSKGTPLTPDVWFDKYGSDSIRYWAAGARLGTDTAFDEQIFKTGRKLVTKLYNASKFVLSFPAPKKVMLTELDRSFLFKLRKMINEAASHFELFNFSGALANIENFFWHSFTDSYLELVKTRAKGEDNWDGMEKDSAIYTLRKALNILLRSFAPFLPFITEEIWSWDFTTESGKMSIHQCSWPGADDFWETGNISNSEIFNLASKCLSAVHSRKSEAGVSLKTEIIRAELKLAKKEVELFSFIEKDLKKAGWIRNINIIETGSVEDFNLTVEMAG